MVSYVNAAPLRSSKREGRSAYVRDNEQREEKLVFPIFYFIFKKKEKGLRFEKEGRKEDDVSNLVEGGEGFLKIYAGTSFETGTLTVASH
jgi:hypothetical protein